jgi:hypothetical protein
MVLHPAIAVVVAVIFNAGTFFGAQSWALTLIRAGNTSVGLRMLERVFRFLYLVFPMVDPFANETAGLHSSLRVLHGDWKYLAYNFGYSLALGAFCYSVALFALERKKLI